MNKLTRHSSFESLKAVERTRTSEATESALRRKSANYDEFKKFIEEIQKNVSTKPKK